MPKGKKYGGRSKGTPNKDCKTIRDAINDLLNNVDIMELYEQQKTPKDKAVFLTDLLEFALPKLNRTTLDGDLELKTDNLPEIKIEVRKRNENQ